MIAKQLDQWYTKPEIAEICISAMNEFGLIGDQHMYIEPSCGTGSFSNALQNKGIRNIRMFDLDPKTQNCEKADWLTINLDTNPNKTIIFGNPPYGKKAKLAVDFINHSFNMANYVCFIVPITLSTSWTAQKNIREDAELIFEETLPLKSFIFEGKEVNVPSLFQIWRKKYKDIRLVKPQTEHEDLEIRIYNKMPTAEKWLDWDWDIAVKRNSKSGDFIEKGQEATREKHWILIKGPIETLRRIDWSKLNDNKMVAGMGKADVIKAYKEITNEN